MKKLSLLLTSICLGIVVSILVFMTTTAKAQTSSSKPINLTFSITHSERYPLTELSKAWISEVEKKTGGRVKITPYWSGTLTSAKDNYDGVVKGISDIGQACFGYSRGRFPVMAVCDLPGYPSIDARVTSSVAWDVYNKFKPKEVEDTHILFSHNFCPGIIATKKKPIKTVADMKGLRIRSTGTSAQVVEALGGVPVTASYFEAFELLDKGTVDGTFLGIEDLVDMHFTEVCDYFLFNPESGYTAAFYVAMNLKKWDSLPSDVQKLFNEVCPKYVDFAGDLWLRLALEAYRKAKAQPGKTIIYFSAEERAKVSGLCVKPMQDKYVKELEDKGLPGGKILDYWLDRSQYWTKKFGTVEWAR